MLGYVLVCKRDRLPLSKRTATLGHVPRSGNEYCVAYTVRYTVVSYGLSTTNAMLPDLSNRTAEVQALAD